MITPQLLHEFDEVYSSACPLFQVEENGVGKLLSDGAERKGSRHGKDREGVTKKNLGLGTWEKE